MPKTPRTQHAPTAREVAPNAVPKIETPFPAKEGLPSSSFLKPLLLWVLVLLLLGVEGVLEQGSDVLGVEGALRHELAL